MIWLVNSTHKFSNILSANRSHYLAGVPYKGKSFFKDLNSRNLFELSPCLVKTKTKIINV